MSNFNFNKVILGGRITADPELKSTPSGVSVTSFTVAVNRRFQGKDSAESQADFITVTAWRQTAEFVTRFFRKASSICIVGSIQTRTWTDPQGQKRYATEVVADEAYFVDGKNDQQSAPSQQSAPPSAYIPDQYAQHMTPQPDFKDVKDDDLPF
jgi:single-strand DNA-binding protein